jgi:hypothetical protein
MAHSGSTFYCRNCADKLGLLSGVQPVTTAPSTYQYDKAVKHTRPTALTPGKHSVLDSGSTADYQAFEQQTFEGGSLEVEKPGKRALILQTTGPIATRYQDDTRVGAADLCRRVLSTESAKAHLYFDSSTNYAGLQCAQCSTSLIY